MSDRTITSRMVRIILPVVCVSLFAGICVWPPGGGTVPPPQPGTEPIEATRVADWHASVVAGAYGDVIAATDAVIAAGPQEPGYADAHLYRGVAIYLQGQPDKALPELRIAETLMDQFAAKYRPQEQLLLYRALMVANASTDHQEEADHYLNLAIQLAPDQAEAIRQELDSRTLAITELKP